LPVTGKVDKTTAEKLEEKIVQKIQDDKNDTQLLDAVTAVKEKLHIAH
jgi:carboxyl-terminal processing protease